MPSEIKPMFLSENLALHQAKSASTLNPEGKKAAEEQKIQKAGQDFEALLLQQMFQSMWQSVPGEGLLSGSKEEGMYRDMLNQALGQSLAENQSIGIKDIIVQDIKKLDKKETK